MNAAVLAILAIATLCEHASSQPVKYDQRQEGDLNVRTDVEDVVFVVVPPQDLITTGMGLVAATAADLFRKNYGGVGPERWPLRTPSKVGFVPLEKSPYKVDLEKSGFKLKKISHAGDPNRYNFHETKNPMKSASETKPTAEVPEKPAVEIVTEVTDETPSTTETKTVKKVLKNDEPKKVVEKDSLEEKKKDKIVADVKGGETKSKPKEKVAEEPPKLIGEGTKEGLDPSSILRLEGCGPDAQRDNTGKCVFKN